MLCRYYHLLLLSHKQILSTNFPVKKPMKLSYIVNINFFSFEKSHLRTVSIQFTAGSELPKINFISLEARQVVCRNLREAVQ